MQPIACCPADDSACEQVDDKGEVQPAFAGPHLGDVGDKWQTSRWRAPSCKGGRKSGFGASALSLNVKRRAI